MYTDAFSVLANRTLWIIKSDEVGQAAEIEVGLRTA